MFTPSELAVLSLLLEVSSSPKSGNVDRCHDTTLSFHQFIISALSAFEGFRMAERGESVGKCIYEAVKKSVHFCGTNVHFGAFLLLIPLVTAKAKSKKNKAEIIAKKASKLIKNSSVEDSIFLLKAYRISKPRTSKAKKYSLDEIKEEDLTINNLNLYRWMLYSEDNFIAKELISEYPISMEGCKMIKEFSKEYNLNDSIVLTYHHLLSKLIDPLIVSKFGKNTAEKVRAMAKKSLDKKTFKELDEKLISLGINPGSIADVVSSSIFLYLSENIETLKEVLVWKSKILDLQRE